MFHSISKCIRGKFSHIELRELAASQVTEANAPFILMDMAAQIPPTIQDPMTVSAQEDIGRFSAAELWNKAAGDKTAMVKALKKAISTPGNYMWGDATVASLLEAGLNLNIVLLAHNKIKSDLVGKSEMTATRAKAREIYSKWVDMAIAKDASLYELTDTQVVQALKKQGYTIDRAMKLASNGSDSSIDLVGWRFPAGTVYRMSKDELGSVVNYSLRGYKDDRDTIFILNKGNVHWVAGACVGFKTILEPSSPDRAYIDSLLKRDAS
jgi:hypothetical protein